MMLVNRRTTGKRQTDLYIGRVKSGGDLWNRKPWEPGWLGNPWTVEEYGREQAVWMYARDFVYFAETQPPFAAALRVVAERLKAGDVLACWCVPELCHGHAILAYLLHYDLIPPPDISVGEQVAAMGAVIRERIPRYADRRRTT